MLIAADGRLEVSSTHPYYFRDGDRHVLLCGVSDRDVFTIWENDKGFSWREYLDLLAAHRLNYVRQDVFSWRGITTWVRYPGQYSNPAWPFRRVGPGKAVDGLPKFDLTQFDQSYFDDRLTPFMREAEKRGVYVELTLFEGFRQARSFADSLYADENNVNDLGLQPRLATSDSALNHPRLLSIQHRFVDKVLAETAVFGNVIYEIANETGGKLWVSHFVDYIHSHPTHPSSLVAAGEQTSAYDPRRGENDIVVKHRGGGGLYATNSDVRNHHDALLRFRVGKPVTHNEYFLFANRSTHDVDFPRKMMWADFTAGGHSNFFDFTFWRGTGRTTDDGQPSRPPPEEILRGGQYLLEFVSRNQILSGPWRLTTSWRRSRRFARAATSGSTRMCLRLRSPARSTCVTCWGTARQPSPYNYPMVSTRSAGTIRSPGDSWARNLRSPAAIVGYRRLFSNRTSCCTFAPVADQRQQQPRRAGQPPLAPTAGRLGLVWKGTAL